MEECLTYSINNKEYIKTKGEGLANIIKGWLNSKGFDVLVYDLVLGDFVNMIVDYSFEENIDIERLKQLTQQVFERFNVEYKLNENIG